MIRLLSITIFLSLVTLSFAANASDFESEVRPFLEKHCLACHGGEKTKGDVDFSIIHSMNDAEANPDLWEAVSLVIKDGEMPPEDEPQPDEKSASAFLNWIDNEFFGEIVSKPGVFQPRRLSGPEYRNTMRSLFGFDLEVDIIEAEQTVTERSLVLKLLPTDPPGASGFINDTRGARLSTNLWDQYSYLSDRALNRFFSETKVASLPEAEKLVRDFVPRALRRDVTEKHITDILENLEGKSGEALVGSLQEEFKALLMSPAFLYRGFLMETDPSAEQQQVDDFELAERLSYFLWEDMPDEELFSLAREGKLHRPETIEALIDRMLASEKSRTLAESFGYQWLLLDQIHHERNDPPYLHALRTQPIDFLHYLFTNDRPVVELIDSEVTYFNSLTANFYGSDRKKLEKFVKPKGIERMVIPLQKVVLEESRSERGAGILTMPGVLGMNEGPILRGTWMLRQILGEHLGEPPADIPPIEAAAKGQDLTFRERFEAHRADKTCALCHDKIDPLGFALEGYDKYGGVIGKNQSRSKKQPKTPEKIDTSGQLPGGESFTSFQELQQLLLTTQREKIIRNAVEQMMAYALCRKLIRSDRPTIDTLTTQILEENGTWRDLICGIAQSVPFTEYLNPKLIQE